MEKMKFNKKKIAVSVTSMILVFATLIAFVPAALASVDRSLEYIELLKQNKTLKILEIAPSESDGVMGYYVKGSEPIANWRDRAALLTSAAAREIYVNNEVNAKLLAKGVMSEQANAAPLYLEDMYDEFYPWEIKDTKDFNALDLENDEAVKVRGTMKETEDEKGDYISNDVYVPVDNFFKNYFDFLSWKTTLGVNLMEKLGEGYTADRLTCSKILALDNEKKSITVFGSTETNWTQAYASDPTMIYDLESVYASPEYYSIEMEEDKFIPGRYRGGSFVLSFDANVLNGKGQVSVIPFDKNGDIVKYSPNISKQYWFRQEMISTGHHEFKFSIPEGSEVKSVQIRFDVNNIKASATLSNISVYKYNHDYFDITQWKTHESSIKKQNDVITVPSKIDEAVKPLYMPTLRENKSYFECEPNTYYTLTYHAELAPGGGKTKVYVVGYNKQGQLIGTNFVAANQWSKNVSGTYSVDFLSSEASYFVLVFNVTGSQKAYYSNISVVKALDYTKEDASATHKQVIDHFSNGDPGSAYGGNIFNFHEWYNSASYGREADSNASFSIVADETNGIINLTNDGATRTSRDFSATDNFYYIPVSDNTSYRLTYIVNSSSTNPHKIKILFYNDKKEFVSEGIFEKTPKVAGPDEYTLDFTTREENCRWIQIGFGNAQNNQRNVFSDISICEKQSPKVYYYNVIFTKIDSIADIATMEEEGTAIYTPKYVLVKDYEALKNIPEGKKYYEYDVYNDEYVEITDFTNIDSTTKIYEFDGVYDFVGHAGDPGVTFNILREFYTAEINYNGHTFVEDPNDIKKIGYGTAYFTKDATSGDFITAGIRNESTVFDPNTEYYILTSVIKENEDSTHRHWVPEGNFVGADDHTALFTRKSDGYRYVGENQGNYKFTPDPNGKEQAVITTPTVFYKGGIINNQWFKKAVLNCNEDEMSTVAVSVTTVSPEYLNSLNPDTLIYFLQGYELFVLSYGGVDGAARYKEDILPEVRNALIQEATDTWEFFDGMGEELTTSQYKIPVMIDSRVCEMKNETFGNGMKFENLPGLAGSLCADLEGIDGGVSKYIYKFNIAHSEGDVKSIVNQSFLDELRKGVNPTTPGTPYYPIYKELEYENFIRSANKDKYSQLDTTVSQAAAIRFILNFRGQRIQRYKEKIRILEIQPYTNQSDLLKNDGSLKEEVKRWFSPTGDLQYVDENNVVREMKIEVATLAMGELAARNGSIVEDNDVIYFGASIDDFEMFGNRETDGKKNDETGKEIPDYADDRMDGMYYTSTGDIVQTGQPGLKRAPLAGLVGGDYKALRSITIDTKLFGKWKIGEALFKDNFLDLWYVDDSDCALRKSGNDMTVSIMNQIKAFAASGRPVIFSDKLVEHEFVGEFSVDISSEIVGWDEKADLPIIEFRADLNTSQSELPAGVQPNFTWFCETASGTNFLDESKSKGTVTHKDDDGDGINEGFYRFVFKEGDSLRGYGDYYAGVTFKFKERKYKGLREITNLRSERVNLDFQNVYYKLRFTTPNLKNDLSSVEAELVLDGEGFMPSLKSNGGRNLIFRFEWASRSVIGTWATAHNKTITYTPDPFDPNSGYDPDVDRKITTKVVFMDDKGNVTTRYGYRLKLFVDELKDNRPTIEIEYATLFEREKEKGGYVRYYNFTPKGDGTRIKSDSGMALNAETFDNSSYAYECVSNVFTNPQNIFSELMLNTNSNLSCNSLLKYANLSAPEIEITQAPVCYPDKIDNGEIEFKFKILNYTDETTATSRYRYEFYVDNNSDSKFSKNELTDANVFGAGNTSLQGNLRASTEEKINEYKFYKKFPKSTSGVVPWKFVIIKVKESDEDTITEQTTHNSITRYSYIKPEKPTDVTAIQVLPSNLETDYHRNASGTSAYDRSYADMYYGSVFLSDIFISEGMTGKNQLDADHFPLKRVINYEVSIGGAVKEFAGTENAKYQSDKSTVFSSNEAREWISTLPNTEDKRAKIKPISVDFTVGTDWNLNIEFKNVTDINKMSVDEVYNAFNEKDMLILGFGDQYGRHEQIGETGIGAIYTNEGFQQAPVRAIGKLIDEGKAVLFCHDTAYFSNNFVSYIANDVANALSEIFFDIKEFFLDVWDTIKKIFGAKVEDRETLEVNLHSSRVKQGYYLNIGLRDKLGLDRYGVTKNIKDRIVTRDRYNEPPRIYSTYYEIMYDNENLKDAHDYSTIYFDGPKNEISAYQNVNNKFTSEMIWNEGEEITVEDRTKEFLTDFYDVAYVPGTARQDVDVFFQGFTDFTIEKFRKDDGIDELPPAMTDKITQVNSGQITCYPYNINAGNEYQLSRKIYKTLDVKPTHDQVYQVSLQTDDMGNGTTVWYALANTDTKFKNNYNSFRNNATNGYFIYTHKNVTYTGSGHSNEFTETEAKLFINTIVAAYRIVADKPSVNYVTPDGQTIINYKTITSSADQEGKITVEADKVNFRVKDTSVDSEMTKSLKVEFYTKVTPIYDESGKNIIDYSYDEADKVGEVDKVKGNAVRSFDLPDSVLAEIAKADKNEVELYARPSSTLTGFSSITKTVYGDHAVLTLRELNLRSLV